MTTIGEALGEARGKLAAAGIETATLDARLLAEAATGLRHEQIIAEPSREIGAGAAETFRRMVARRQSHEPVSRILCQREFYGRIFEVTPAVLDPRPDTEALIELALPHVTPATRILDLGTGSGAIVITLLAECAEVRGVATDLSAEALAVASRNAKLHSVAERIEWLHCTWFETVDGQFHLIVSNPPYIPLGDIAKLPPEVHGFDPAIALDGGPDGLEAYRRIAAGAGVHLAPGGHILVEIGAGQEQEVSAVFAASGFRRESAKADLAGHVRCLAFTRP